MEQITFPTSIFLEVLTYTIPLHLRKNIIHLQNDATFISSSAGQEHGFTFLKEGEEPQAIGFGSN